MNNKNWIFKVILFGIFFLVTNKAIAIDERYAALPMMGNQIAKDSTNLVQDTVFFNLGLRPTQSTFGVNNYITFKLDEFSTIVLPDSLNVSITFKVYFSKWLNGNVVIDSSELKTLFIEYNKFRNYQNKGIYTFSGGFKSQVKIFSVTSTFSSGNFDTYKNALVLENEILVTREYNFDPAINVVQNISGILGSSSDQDSCSSAGEFLVSWSKVPVADEYDLEWTYVDSSAINNYYIFGTTTFDPKKIFLHNASRVSIINESYQIPVLYENGGILFYRVRPVRIKQSGQRIEAIWSSNFTGGLGSYGYIGHELNLNWQATTSFAEEGKRKSVVLYFDGTLRNRQTVTKDNSNCYTIIAETMYDFQGRPVIQVMPAPTLNRLIGFTPGFNRDINGVDYDKSIYDTDASGGINNCNALLPGMGTLSGSSKYYSSINELAGNGFNKYIPDAKLFPFAETRYTPDNTGRIAMQGGVGQEFQINKLDTDEHSHETRYFYGSADQEELDALFGTEVGVSTHYFKNMVKDANGQYSVSYNDMHGRTVATALAGKPESKLDSLLTSNRKTIVKKLLDTTNNLIFGTSIISSKSLIVTSVGPHRFEYSLNSDSINILACDMNSICYDCLYDLEISISNDCGNPGDQPITIRRTNYNPAVIDTLCNTLVSFPSVDTSIILTQGSYTITKNLTISQSGFDKYREIYLRRNLCKTLQQYIDEQQQIYLSQIECFPTCQSCVDSLGTWATWRPRYMANNNIPVTDTAAFREQSWMAFKTQESSCNALCKNTGIHTSIREQMLIDMTAPYGQYAEYDSSYDPHNIFYTNNGLLGLRFKQLPRGAFYKDEYGRPDSIINAAGLKVPPDHHTITDVEFLDNFKTSWAETLIELHPEYCKLLKTESFASSHIWDEKFEEINTFQQAIDSGFLNPSAFTGLPGTSIYTPPVASSRDPFFTTLETSYAAAFKDSLLKIIKTIVPNISAWSLATIMAHCGTDVDADDEQCFNDYKSIDSAFKIIGCSGELDFAWRHFREMYLNKKSQIVEKVIKISCPVVKTLPWHTLNFPDIDSLDGTNNLPLNSSVGNDSLNNFIDANCKAYVNQWLLEMKPCNLTSEDSGYIFPRLIAVCKGGGDLNHVFGSSTTRHGTTSTYGNTSFIEVLKNKLGNRYDSTCNAFLISAPKPYDKQPAYSNIEVWNKPDSCQCDKITGLYQEYKKTIFGVTTFSTFVLNKTGNLINDSALDTLVSLCTNLISCKFLQQPIILPPALQCNTTSACISCIDIKSKYNSFKTEFPGVLPHENPIDSFQIKSNVLFENYMNYQFGYNKKASEYIAFMDTCDVEIFSDSLYSDSLKKLLFTFQSEIYNQDIPKFDIGGCDTSKIKVSTLNSYYHTPSINLEKWMYNGIFKTPYNDSTSYTPNFLYVDTLCFDSSLIVESRLRSPFSSKGFNWYTNSGRTAAEYNTSVLVYNFDNKSVVFWLIYGNKWKGYIPGLNDSIYGYVKVYENGINISTHNYFPLGLKHLGEWINLKADFTNNKIKFYVNNALVDTGSFNVTPSKFYSFIPEPYGFDFQMDWIKMYDKQNRLRFFEDYNGCDALAKQTLSNCIPDCKQQFVNYFNNSQNTNYSFSRIDSLYFSTSGIHPDPCFSDPVNCDHLEQALVEYNLKKFNIYHDSTGLEYKVWSQGHNYVARDTSIHKLNLKDFIRNGILSSPDSVTFSPGDFSYSNSISICTGNEFTFSTRIRVKPGLDATGAQEMFNLYPDNGLLLPMFTGTGYASGFLGSYYDLNNVYHSNNNFNGHANMFTVFNEWKDLKVTFKNNKAFVYINDTLKGSIHYPGNFFQLNGFSMSGWYNHTLQYEWVKIYDGNGILQMQEDFNDYTNFIKPTIDFICPTYNCKDDFISFFNSRLNTNYNYNQLIEIYKTKCGIDIEPCGPVSGPTLCGTNEPVFPQVSVPPLSPCADSTLVSVGTGTLLYEAYKDSLLNSFNDRYLEKCLKARYNETFKVTAPVSEFHYTLYYYDQAGNLVKTVPPAGVDVSKFNWAEAWSDSVKVARTNATLLTPSHSLNTQYRYNTLNQVVTQTTPDAGLSKFWYDRLGRLVLSQNAKQKANSYNEYHALYSYTKYDYLGRIAEVGQIKNNSNSEPVTNILTRDNELLNAWYAGRNNLREEITNTFYDTKYYGFIGFENSLLWQFNLRNRVSYTSYTDTSNLGNYNQATFYSYDIHGNVDTFLNDYGHSLTPGLANIMNVQSVNANRWKRMVYSYDLISGKVNHVAFQPPRGNVYYPDMFYHRYSYDAENRLILAETSKDSITWEKEARYDYYRHGPLARTVIGEQLVQGIDYGYTLQGWLKGINAISISDGSNDMGNDGKLNGANQYIGRDALGFNLNYFASDYIPINATVNPFPGVSSYLPSGANKPLYNGNISSMAVNIKFPSPTAQQVPQLYNYTYDQLNRITAMNVYKGLSESNNTWSALAHTNDYKEGITYDGNGNIHRYLRNGYAAANIDLDSLTYNYYPNTNRLRYVKDYTPNANYADDLDNHSNPDNYLYDEIGNLISDSKEGINKITWNVYGKIREIERTATSENPVTNISYTYDGSGNRISKKVVKGTGDSVNYTWYVRDVSGNVMSTYQGNGPADGTISAATTNFNLKEQHLYGSSRLGIQNRNENINATFIKPESVRNARGFKFYEMTNHLGNVLVTISDKKIGADNNSDGIIDYYNSDVVTATDYYPFGMTMPGRKYSNSAGAYRYGFNGKENDNEVKGEGNQQDYGMRIYDPRLGRFLSEDPITKDYPELTPYQFASNRPIDGIDQDGLEYAKANMHSDATVVRHNSDPAIAFKQVAAAPTRQRALFFADVQSRVKTQTGSAMTRYKEPDAVKKQRNATLQKNHNASVVPENHWTRNKYLNNFSERAVEPMAEMAIGEGIGGLAAKGISLLMKSGSSKGFGLAYRAVNSSFSESTVQQGFYRSGFPGRLGNDGIYANSTIEGAIKEFSFHNPNIKATVFEVKYPISKPLSISPPSQPNSYFAGPMPFTEGANILAAPSLRAPGTTNLLIRQGAEVGAKVKTP